MSDSPTTRDDLSIQARIGIGLARKIFAARGNHSEAHLSEKELAHICEGAAKLALDLYKKAVLVGAAI